MGTTSQEEKRRFRGKGKRRSGAPRQFWNGPDDSLRTEDLREALRARTALEDPGTGGQPPAGITMEYWNVGILGRWPVLQPIVPIFHCSIIPILLSSSAGGRLCQDFRPRRASLGSCARTEPTGPKPTRPEEGRARPASPLNRLFSWSPWEWPHLPGLTGICLSSNPSNPGWLEFNPAFGRNQAFIALRVPAGRAWIDDADPLKLK